MMMTMMMYTKATQWYRDVTSYGTDCAGNSGGLHCACAVFAYFRRRRSVNRRRADNVISRCSWRKRRWRHHRCRLGAHVVAANRLQQYCLTIIMSSFVSITCFCPFACQNEIKPWLRVHFKNSTLLHDACLAVS